MKKTIRLLLISVDELWWLRVSVLPIRLWRLLLRPPGSPRQAGSSREAGRPKYSTGTEQETVEQYGASLQSTNESAHQGAEDESGSAAVEGPSRWRTACYR